MIPVWMCHSYIARLQPTRAEKCPLHIFTKLCFFQAIKVQLEHEPIEPWPMKEIYGEEVER